MAGFLSNVFDTANMQGTDGGSQASEQSYSAAVEDEAEFEEEFTVETDFEAEFEDAEGTEHSFSNSQDVTVTIDAYAAVGVAADASQGSMTQDEGLL